MVDLRRGPRGTDGAPFVMPEPRDGSSLIIVTHNWCDPTTWYTQSVAVSGETLEDSGDGLTFNSDHTHWIDLNHGKIYREDLIKEPYLPSVYIDGVEKTERPSFSDSGGDFVINYAAGTVTFSQAPSGTVTADYHYENGSQFIVAPAQNKKLIIESSEVQFAKNIDIQDTIHFQVWIYNPYDLPNKIPYTEPTTYKTIKDFIDESRGVYPEVSAIGGSTRGLTNPHVTFPFNYITVKELKYSYGAEIRIWLENGTAFGGEFGTATFYCTSKADE